MQWSWAVPLWLFTLCQFCSITKLCALDSGFNSVSLLAFVLRMLSNLMQCLSRWRFRQLVTVSPASSSAGKRSLYLLKRELLSASVPLMVREHLRIPLLPSALGPMRPCCPSSWLHQLPACCRHQGLVCVERLIVLSCVVAAIAKLSYAIHAAYTSIVDGRCRDMMC